MRRHGSRVVMAALVLGACSSDDAATPSPSPAPTTTSTSTTPPPGPGGPAPLFTLPTSLDAFGQGCSLDGQRDINDECVSDFYDHPFPSDFRRENGRARWSGFPNPRKLAPIKLYISVLDRLLDGFSPQSGGHLRFAGPIDPTGLPADALASTQPTSTVQLIDVDDASPERGTRRPISLHYREKIGVYWAPFSLAFAPALGLPLRPHTRYALVVTRDLKGAGGRELGHSAELDAVLGLPGATPSAQASALASSWAPALTALEAAGVKRDRIAHLTVFTTTDPTSELIAVRDHVRSTFPAPTASAWTAKEQTADYDVYEGSYGPSPDYQKGNLPFVTDQDGGGFELDASGVPQLQRQFDLRFALVVPKASACPPPPGGYPVVLYAHGTGGDYRSFVDDKTAQALAQRCLASMGIDQIFHGTRPGAPTGPDAESKVQLLFFNVDNPTAARTNGRQAAVDEVQRARLFTETHATVPAAVSRTGAEIAFDGSRVLFFGHSQGGQNGPLFLAVDDAARGGVLSGSASVFAIALLEKTKPTPSVAGVVRSVFLGLKSEQYEELNLWHPALGLAQTLIDTSDPIHYVGHMILRPRAGFAPKSIYQTEGIGPDGVGDSYSPPHGIEVQAVATGLPLMNPVIHPIAELSVAGLGTVDIPAAGLSGNLAGGKASGVLAQWAPPGKSDGHFVVFNVPQARAQAAQFCRNLADDPVGRVPAP